MLELEKGLDDILHRGPCMDRHGSMVRVDVNKVQLCMQFIYV